MVVGLVVIEFEDFAFNSILGRPERLKDLVISLLNWQFILLQIGRESKILSIN